MPSFVWKGQDQRRGQSRRASARRHPRRRRSLALRRQQIQVTSIREKGREITLIPAADLAQGPRQAHRHLHPPVLGDARRRPAAGAVPGDPRRAGGEQDLRRPSSRQVRSDVESGSSLADAMRKHPKAFDDLYVNMVAAGEAGGILDVILQRLSAYIEKAVKLKSQVKSALIYPVTVIFIAVGVVFIILWKVIPVFAQLFAGLGGELPFLTRIVIGASATSSAASGGFSSSAWWSSSSFLRSTATTRPTAAAGVIDGLHAQDPDHRHAAAQDRGGPLLPHPLHPDLLRRADPRRPRDHRQDLRQRDHRGRGHGGAQERRGRQDDQRAAGRDQGVPADGGADDQRRRADRRPRPDAVEDRRLLRGRGRHRGGRPDEAASSR